MTVPCTCGMRESCPDCCTCDADAATELETIVVEGKRPKSPVPLIDLTGGRAPAPQP